MAKLITGIIPDQWQDLENLVREILAECGMESERNVKLEIPRGNVAVDVLAEETIDGITSRIICECKNWSSNIPQEVVHGFRTVMQETGANRGYIISKAGFQSGAIAAANSTNIELLTFEEFQDLYFVKWIEARAWAIERKVGDVNTYFEPFGIPGIHLLEDNESEREKYIGVWEKHLFVGFVLPFFSPYSRMVSRHSYPNLPIDTAMIEEKGIAIPDDLKTISTYKEFLEKLEGYAEQALRDLRAINPITRDMPFDEVKTDD